MSSQSTDIEKELVSSLKPKREINSSLLLKLGLFIALIFYLYSLFWGESSIGVLQSAKERYNKLNSEYIKIQNENQKLQKKHFELIQLTPQRG